jgi:hypothetical protein
MNENSKNMARWHARGLRQGDPVSPTLFILMMNALTAAVKFAEAQGSFSAFERSGVRHCLSLFAHDVVLFIKPTRQEADTAMQIMTAFGEASGLK